MRILSAVDRFEQLVVWQKARKLTNDVYSVTRQGCFVKDFGLAGQIQRAAVSLMSNIAEGSERETTKEFIRFLSIAKGSCAEVRSQLYVAFDAKYLSEAEFAQLREQANEVGRLLHGLMLSLQRKL